MPKFPLSFPCSAAASSLGLILLLQISASPAAAQSATLLFDPFTHPGTTAGTLTSDLNTNVPARQAAGLLAMTYGKASTHAANTVSLEESTTNALFPGGDDVLHLRTVKQSAASAAGIDSQAAMRSATNLAPHVVGRKWSVSFPCAMARNDVAITDVWLALSLGDDATVQGPDNALADAALLINGSKGWKIYTDNTQPAPNNGTFTSTTATAFPASFVSQKLIVTMEVDEGVTPSVFTAKLQVGAAEQTLGPYPVTWENATTRAFEIRAHQGGVNTAIAGRLLDLRVNDLVVSVANPPAVPQLITTPPASQNLWVGDELRLTSTAWGTPPPTFVWSLNGTPIPGATGASYVVSNAATAQAGTYQVTATNFNGSVSASSQVSVIYPTPQQRTTESAGPSSRGSGFAFTEILFHPYSGPTPTTDSSFVELYNSNPWPEDLSGWQITGNVDYTFPANTTIPAKSYLVIAGNDIAFASRYPGVAKLGPYTGLLSRNNGTLRLRSRSGSIRLEAAYDTNEFWHAAADGTGHSLVLARPSLGNSLPAAWAPSANRGGSPGTADPIPGDALRHLSLLAADPRVGVTLQNTAGLSVDISGCGLSNSPVALLAHVFPSGTILAPRQTLTVLPAFAMPFAETNYFLTNPAQTAVVAAGKFRPRAVQKVRVSEVCASPTTGLDTDQWLEIVNLETTEVSLADWRLTGGVGYTFPAGASIAPGGHVVVARDKARFLATAASAPAAGTLFGPFTGNLSDGGEFITLQARETIGAEIVKLTADQIRCPAVPDASAGHTMERVHPLRDGLEPANWRPTQTDTAAWTTVEITGALDLLHPGVGTLAAPFSQIQIFLMGDGECLLDDVTVLDSAQAAVNTNGNFESGLTGWVSDGNQVATLAPGLGQGGSAAARLTATGSGGPDGNRLRCVLTGALTANTQATVRAKVKWLRGCPEIIVRLQGGWLEAYGLLSRPAATGNPFSSPSVAATGPLVRNVITRPVIPATGVPFRVFAEAQGDSRAITGVTLSYRLDPAATINVLPMSDAGTGGDLAAGDGIFTAIVPGQPAGTMVAYTVTAVQSGGLFNTWPETGDESLVRVADTMPSGGDFATYRLWMTAATVSAWAGRGKFSNLPMPLTYVYADQRVVHGCRAYYAGSEATTPGYTSPVGGNCAYNLAFPPTSPVLEADSMQLDWPVRDSTDQREQLMFEWAEELALPTLYRRHVHLYANGIRRGLINDDVQRPGQGTLNQYYPNDSGGALFKTNNYVETTDTNSTRLDAAAPNLLTHYDSPAGSGQHKLARYRWNWRPRATSTQNDFSEIFSLVDALNTTATGPAYEAATRARINTTQWMRTFAFFDLCAYWDSFGNSNRKNSYLYKPKRSGWEIISYDMDVGLGVFNDPVNLALFLAAGTGDTAVNTFQAHPAYRREYWRTVLEAFATFFTPDPANARTYQRLQAKWTALQAVPGLTSPFVPGGAYALSIPQWINNRRAFIQTELDAAGVLGPFALTSPATGGTTAVGEITLSGTAPAGVARITCNGYDLPLSWTSLTAWTAPFILRSGLNTLSIQAWDGFGVQTGAASLSITFTGQNNWAPLKINEWMASNTTASGILDPADGDPDDWFELFNPTNAPVQLNGWFLTDTAAEPRQFTIPNGVTVPAGGYLTVWADGETLQTSLATRPDLHVGFRLSQSGDSIILHAPDDSLIDSVAFGAQVNNRSQGRTTDGGPDIDYLSAASRAGANHPAIAPLALEWRPGGKLCLPQTLSGFLYEIDASEDLNDWLSPIAVEGADGALEFDTDQTPPRQFYRARRSPMR